MKLRDSDSFFGKQNDETSGNKKENFLSNNLQRSHKPKKFLETMTTNHALTDNGTPQLREKIESSFHWQTAKLTPPYGTHDFFWCSNFGQKGALYVGACGNFNSHFTPQRPFVQQTLNVKVFRLSSCVKILNRNKYTPTQRKGRTPQPSITWSRHTVTWTCIPGGK